LVLIDVGENTPIGPFGVAIFVELKAPGKKPTPAQQRDHERRRAMGFRVEVLDSIEAVDEFVEGL
jgi:hypothetical protein